MKRHLRILIVDDHPMTIWGYEVLLKNLETEYSFDIESAKNCDEVLKKMKVPKQHFFDIVLLDISLPASQNGFVVSGEDLGLKIGLKFPKTKIIVHTGLGDQQRIVNIFKSLDPEGFMIKTDIDPQTLSDAIYSVLNGHTYYGDNTNKFADQ